MKIQLSVILFAFLLFGSDYVYGQKLTSDPYADQIYGGYKNGIVGATSGQASVTISGAAQYEIPLDIPKGIGGLTPELTISYNSSNRDGIIGWGFTLEGLSQISRTVTPLLHTNTSYPISLTDDDYYALDGNILNMRVYGSYGKCYFLRYEDTTLFKSDETYSTFVGQSGNGSTVTYGGTANSRVYAQGSYSNKVLLWLLNEVCDKNGNYYTITYQQNEGGEAYPVRIDYSGNKNAGVAPSKSIRFAYSPRPTTNVTFIKSSQLHIEHKLQSIAIYNNENCIKKYELEYSDSPVTNIPLLKSITEYGSDNNSFYNPTRFEWEVLNKYSIDKAASGYNEKFADAEIYVGDFNGDGKSDIIAAPGADAKWKEWRLFTSQGNGNLDFELSGTLDSKYKDLVTGDFNGDGKDELLQIIKSSKSSLALQQSTMAQNIENLDSDSGVEISFISPIEHIAISTVSEEDSITKSIPPMKASTQFYAWQHYENRVCEVVSGDFNGDGASDLMIYYPNETGYKIIHSLWDNTNELFKPLGKAMELDAGYDWEKVHLGDFNGDGKTDIMNVTVDGYVLFISDENGIPQYAQKGVWPQSDFHLAFGDFNGDGKTDVLATGHEKNDQWSSFNINIWTGNGFEKYTVPHYFNSSDYIVYVADINGDGKDDFYAIKKEADRINSTATYYFINEGDGTSFIKNTVYHANAMDRYTYYLGDFDGNGRTDIIGIGTSKEYTAPSGHGSVSNKGKYETYLSPVGFDRILTRITDGLGKETKFEYSHMSDLSIHTPKMYTYPIKSTSYPLEIVKRMHQSDGMGGYRTKGYSYVGGRSHSRGMGFLGFETFIEQDFAANTTTKQTYECYGNFCFIALKKKTLSFFGSLHSVTDYTNKLAVIGAGARTFYPIYSKESIYEHESEIYKGCREKRRTIDKFGNTISETEIFNGIDSIVNTTEFFTINDKNIRPVKWTMSFPSSSTTEYFREGTLPMTTSKKMEYDSNFNLIKCENYGNNELLTTEQMTYDAAGNILSKTQSAGTSSRTEKYGYSELLYKISEQDAENYVSSFSYDSSTGMMTKSVEAAATIEEYTYDPFFNVSKCLKNSKIESCQLRRWSAGSPDAPSNSVYLNYIETAGESPIVEFYDLVGNKIREVKIVFGGKKVYVDWEYDNLGRVYSVTMPYFQGDTPQYSYYEYDDLGRISSLEHPDGSSNSYYYYHNFEGGMNTDFVNEIGHGITKETNSRGELISVTDADDNKITYKYDAIGNCTQIITPTKVIEMAYDNAGNRTTLNDPDCGIYTFTYDGFGNVKERAHGESSTTISFKYDKLNRVIRKKSSENDIHITYHPTILGATTNMIDSITGVSTKRYYTKHGKLSSEDRKINKDEWRITFYYDNFDRQYRIYYPNCNETINEYDDYGNLKKVIVSTVEFGSSDVWELKNVDEHNRPIRYTLGNGIEVSKEYNPENGLLQKTSHNGIMSQEYKYDFVGNMISRYDSISGKTERFKYDVNERLSKVYVDNVLTDEVEYDAAGNILKRASIGSMSYFHGTNRIETVNCNNTASLKIWDEISYNSDGKVTKIKQGNATLDIIYGNDGQRIRSTYLSPTKKCDITYFGNLYQEEHNEGEDWVSDRIFMQETNASLSILTEITARRHFCTMMCWALQ